MMFSETLEKSIPDCITSCQHYQRFAKTQLCERDPFLDCVPVTLKDNFQ